MSVKSFVNSRNGRLGMAVAGMSILGIGIAAAILWWLIYLPNLGLGVVDEKVLESGKSNFNKIEVVQEENPLIGLPSSTLEITDSDNSDLPVTAFDFAQRAIEGSSRESLVNTHSFREPREGSSNMSYDFMFYSGSLSDYADDGAFIAATRQFEDLAEFGTDSLKYTSKPISSGGRELKIDLTAESSFSGTTEQSFISSWGELTKNLGEAVKLNDGTRIDITLRDSTGTLTLNAVINSTESAAAAAAIDPGLWHTFNVYLASGPYDFLDARKISYSLERTSQDSVMTITVGDQALEPAEIEKRMWEAARESDEGALFPGSYITYVVVDGDPNPLLFFPSSSRNW
jgi:hypothetical protein